MTEDSLAVYLQQHMPEVYRRHTQAMYFFPEWLTFPPSAVMEIMLRLVGSSLDITSAINDFRLSYHQDFANVQSVACRYLNAPSGSANAALLAQALSTALRNWGACRRRSPILRPVPQIVSALKDKRLHERLLKLSQQSLAAFSINLQEHRLLDSDAPLNDVGAFDQEILGILNTLADVLFFNNTRITYLMKPYFANAKATALPSSSRAIHIASALGLPPSGCGWREPNPDCARFWPSGRSSSSLWPVVGRRAPLALLTTTYDVISTIIEASLTCVVPR